MSTLEEHEAEQAVITAQTSKLPPDPDGQNGDRAEWAELAILAFRKATGTDEEDAVCDLIADLQHWCDRNGYDFEAEVKRGNGHYWAETQTEGGW